MEIIIRLNQERCMEVTMNKINLVDKFNKFNDYWSPKIVGELNEFYIKLAKLKGEFVWHHHDNEDELFMVVRGKLIIKLEDRDICLQEGEIFIIPKGVEHMPVAENEVHVMMIEPKTTLNTGNLKNEQTFKILDRI